ncbi:MAG: hypothetical protein GY909_08540 [Oligoflexia bacterium]|nr:hypothetical protein [Oligoflexia bacterium]
MLNLKRKHLMKLMVILAMMPINILASRFVLQTQHYDRSDGESRAVYLDTVKRQLVVKELSWNESIVNQVGNGQRPRFEFPANVDSLSSLNSKVLDERYDVEVDYEYLDLSSREKSKSAVRELRDYIPSDQTLNIVNQSRMTIARSDNKYQLIHRGRKGRDEAAVYYNEKTGEIILKEVDHRKSGLPNKTLPPRISFPSDLNGRENNITISDEDSWSAKTPFQLHKAIEGLKDQLDDWDLSLDESIFNESKRKLQEKMTQFVRVGRTRDSDDSRYYHEAWYNPITNEIIHRKLYRRSGKEYIKAETVFSLSDEQDFQKAKRRMRDEGLFSSDEFDNYRDMNLSNCQDVIRSYLNPIDTSGFSDVTDVLYQQFLEGALGNRPTVTDSGEMIIQTNLENPRLPLKVRMNANGEIASVNFARRLSNEEKDQLKIQEEVGLNGKKIFAVKRYDEYNDEWITVMALTSEDVEADGNGKKGKLAIYVKGLKSDGDFRYDDFEKNTYDFKMNVDGKVTQADKRRRLTGLETDPYNYPVSRGGNGGFTNFLFRTFLGSDSRRDKVNEAVLEQSMEALSSPDYAGVITEEEIRVLSREITDSVGQRTRNFDSSLGRIEAVAAEESYTRFGSIILERTLSGLLTTEPESQIKSIVDNTMEGFNVCLKRSSDARNLAEANRCMDIFSREAPVEIGRDILGLKLRQADMGDIVGYSTRQFNACIQDEYYPLFSRRENNETPEGSLDVVKGCLYQAFLQSVEKATPAVIESELGQISKDMGINLSFSEAQQQQAMNKVNACIEEKKLAAKTSYGIQTDFNALANLDPDEFEQELFSCVNLLINDVSHYVADVALQAKLSAIEDFTPEQRNRIAQSSIENSFSSCMSQQMSIIDRQTSAYKTRKAELERTANGSAVIVDVKVPGLEATECIRSLTNFTVGQSTEQIIKNMLGEEKYNQLMGNNQTKSNFMACFAAENTRLNQELDVVLVQEAGLSPEDKARRVKSRDELSDNKTAQCIKQAINWASYHAAGDMVVDKLKENPEYSFIEITEENKAVIGRFIQSCFETEMEKYNTVDSILANQEKVTDYCGAQMLKDSGVQDIVIRPILVRALADGGMTGEQAEPLIGVLSRGLNNKIKDIDTIDGVIQAASTFKEEGLILVVNEVLEEKIEEQLGGNAQDNPQVRAMITRVQSELMSPSGKDYQRRLSEAVNSEDSGDLTRVLDEFKKDATLMIAPAVIQKSAMELLADGIFNTEEEAQRLVNFGEQQLKICMEAPRREGESSDDQIDRCIMTTKVESTYFVLDDRLRDTLNNHRLAKDAISVKRKDEIASSLVNNDTRAQIRRIESLEDPILRQAEFDNFVASFKADSTYAVFNEILPSIVDEKLPQGNAQRDRIIQESSTFMNSCVSAYKATSRQFFVDRSVSAEEFDPNKNLDECVNRVTVKLTGEILPETFKNLIGMFDSEVNQYEDFLQRTRVQYETCIGKRSFLQLSDAFGSASDACLNTVVLKQIPDLISELTNRNPPVLAKNPETLRKARMCEQQVKDNYAQVSGNTTPTSMATDNYFETVLNAKANPPATLDWLLAEVQNCLINNVAPSVLDDYVARVSTDPRLSVSEDQKEALESLSEMIGSILSYTHNGKQTRIVFGSSSDTDEPAETQTRPASGSNTDQASEEESEPIINMMLSMEPLILNYIDLVNAYDPTLVSVALPKLEEDVKKHLRENNGVLELDKFYDILADSDFMTGVIESIISKSVREEVEKALKAEGASTSVTSILASKQMIHRIFSSGDGKRAFDNIKKHYLVPLLKGELDSTAIPEHLINQAKVALGRDQGKGGFSEVLFSSIIQKQLDDKQAWIESGFWLPFKAAGAGLQGLNRNLDFTWGSRYTTSQFALRNTPSGMKAVRTFSNKILIPKFLGTLSSSSEESAKEEITEQIREAMDENGPNAYENAWNSIWN